MPVQVNLTFKLFIVLYAVKSSPICYALLCRKLGHKSIPQEGVIKLSILQDTGTIVSTYKLLPPGHNEPHELWLQAYEQPGTAVTAVARYLLTTAGMQQAIRLKTYTVGHTPSNLSSCLTTTSHLCQSFQDGLNMRISIRLPVTLLLLSLCSHYVQAQFPGLDLFRPLQNLFQPVMRFFGAGPKFRDDGTQSPQSTGRDKLFPDDCGRDENKGTGKLCFPDGKLCEESKCSCSSDFALNNHHRSRPNFFSYTNETISFRSHFKIGPQ